MAARPASARVQRKGGKGEQEARGVQQLFILNRLRKVKAPPGKGSPKPQMIFEGREHRSGGDSDVWCVLPGSLWVIQELCV